MAFVVAYLLLGPIQGLVTVVGIAAAAWAVEAGNKNAREVETYRKEWLGRRKKPGNPPLRQTSDLDATDGKSVDEEDPGTPHRGS